MRTFVAMIVLAMLESTTGDDQAAMRQADLAMSRATASRDMEAFLSFLGDDVAFLGSGPSIATGKQGVRELWARLFEVSGPTLAWLPTHAVVSSSKDLGYTLGRFELTSWSTDGSPTVTTGDYVTVWKKDAEGAWKVLFDAGQDEVPHGRITRHRIREEISSAGDLAAEIGTCEIAIGGKKKSAEQRSYKYLTIRKGSGPGKGKILLETAIPVPAASS